MFTYRNQAVHRSPIAISEVCLDAGYGALWIVLLVFITVAVFRRKQL